MPKRLFIKDGGLTSSIPTPAGYTVIGSDNGTPKKQVQSTISDIGGYTQPYKVYTALLTQSITIPPGTNPPTATVLENTLGEITYSYIAPGFYKIISSGLFTVGKTFVMIGKANTNTNNFDGIPNIGYYELTVNEISISSSNSADNQGVTNGLIADLPIEIRVYN